MTFQERLEELISRANITDHQADMPLDGYYKWRLQALWLLTQWLGDRHTYTTEFDMWVSGQPDQLSVGQNVLAGRGILDALMEDWDRGHISAKSEHP